MRGVHTKQTTRVRSSKNGSNHKDEFIPNLLLRSVRKQQGWSQQEVADKLGVAALSVGRWERGQVVPNGYDLKMLCNLYGKAAEELGFLDKKELSMSEGFGESDQVYGELLEANHPSFHKQLKHERRMRGWTQEQLAAKVGIDHKTIARWERGDSFPRLYARQALARVLGKSFQELGLSTSSDVGKVRRFRTTHTLSVNLPVSCGDCEQLGVIAWLDTIVIEPSRGSTTVYIRFTNKTKEDAGLRLESVSLTDPDGNFSLGQSIESFLLEAKQSTQLSVVFDWIPQQKLVCKLQIVLIRPGKWRNTYRPFQLDI